MGVNDRLERYIIEYQIYVWYNQKIEYFIV